jgi:hypothetical protein
MDKSKLEALSALLTRLNNISQAMSNFSRDYSGRKSVEKVSVRQNQI